MMNEEVSKLKNKLSNLMDDIKRENSDLRPKLIREATKIAEDILKQEPLSADIFSDLGFLYFLSKNYNHASMLISKSLSINSNNVLALNRLALLKNAVGDFKQSMKLTEKALEIDKNSSIAKCNLAISYRYLNEENKALKLVKEVLRDDTTNALAHYTYAQISLGKKDFLTGFKELEWRKKEFSSIVENMVKEIPFWNGEDLCDKTIIINPEREIDVIMFARFVIEISKKSKQVIFRCFENLYKLMKTNMPSNVKVVKMRDNVAADFQVMILSIPYFLKTTSENLPTFHIKPNVKEMEKTKYLFDGKVNKIGFCFSKGGEGSIRSINEIEKKQAFEMAYKQAFDSDKYSFFSLNHEEISSKNITDLSNFIYEYDKLASVISHLDLLISFDNSVAHIASSMNKETWILTKKMSGWRLVENNKKDGCLWYPNTKIIKIDDNTSIESVFDKINYMIEKKFQ